MLILRETVDLIALADVYSVSPREPDVFIT